MSHPDQESTQPAVVCPYRFSDHPAAMIDFLELVGLGVIIRRHDYAVLEGSGGRVAVHPVSTSAVGCQMTGLSFDVADVVLATEQLTADGIEASWWDEAWGRQARVSGPTGLVSINAEMEDFHGYQAANPEERATSTSTITVVAVVFTTDLDALTTFFGRLGYSPGSDQAPGWRPLRARAADGALGLHAAETDGLDQHGYLTAALSFETSEPLDRLAERLRAAGHSVEECTAASVPPTDILAVTDPDGERIEIHPAKSDRVPA